MYSFSNDYSEGAHPRILKALIDTNLEQTIGYGEDRYTLEAIELLKKHIGRHDIDIHLLPGGTHTNLTAISAFLRPHEAVIAAETAHILVHETGAIEATGHKVISTQVDDGKLKPSMLQKVLEEHCDEHMVKPRLVYISNSTEVGTVYDREEIEQLSSFCRKNRLLFFMDGARLGSALCCSNSGLKLADLAKWLDAFYIGGTKNGALIGEALIICREDLKEDFRFHMKQKGALLAKGRILGIQFLELFKDDLYFELARHANDMAMLLRDGIRKAGFDSLTDSPSNQQFPILPDSLIASLQEKYTFNIGARIDPDHSVIRLVTSWATPKEAVQDFIADLKRLQNVN